MRRDSIATRPLPVIVDADAVSKIARRDPRTRGMLERLASQREAIIVAPLIGVTQALAQGVGERAIERLAEAIFESVGLDLLRARTAAHLLRDSRTTDVPDALVCGEALLRVPSVLITCDPGSMRRLLDTDPRGPRVAVWRV